MITLNMSKQQFDRVDFSGEDLRKQRMDHSSFLYCNFDKANLSEVDCTASDFYGSTFKDSICYRTNFTDCKMCNVVFDPKDAFGAIFSLQCDSFSGMQPNQLWFLSWLMMACSMNPLPGPVQKNFVDEIIAMIGAERYVKLKEMLSRREL